MSLVTAPRAEVMPRVWRAIEAVYGTRRTAFRPHRRSSPRANEARAAMSAILGMAGIRPIQIRQWLRLAHETQRLLAYDHSNSLRDPRRAEEFRRCLRLLGMPEKINRNGVDVV